MALVERVCAWCGRSMGWKEAAGDRETHGICEECAKEFRTSAGLGRGEGGRASRNARRRRVGEYLARRAARGDRTAAQRIAEDRELREPGFLERVTGEFDVVREAMIDQEAALFTEPSERTPGDAWIKVEFGKAVVVDGELMVDGFGEPTSGRAAVKTKEPEGYKDVFEERYDGNRETSVESRLVVEATAQRLGIEPWLVEGALAAADHDDVDEDGVLRPDLYGLMYGTVEVMEPAGRFRSGGRTLKCDECGSDRDFIEDGRGNILCACQACPDCNMVDAYGFHEPGCPRVRDDYDAEDEDDVEDEGE